MNHCNLVKTTAIGGLIAVSSAFFLFYVPHSVVGCGSYCPLSIHVVNGEIKYVNIDNIGDDGYDALHYILCLFTLAFNVSRRAYSPDFLKY